jgi:hypothetical protein
VLSDVLDDPSALVRGNPAAARPDEVRLSGPRAHPQQLQPFWPTCELVATNQTAQPTISTCVSHDLAAVRKVRRDLADGMSAVGAVRARLIGNSDPFTARGGDLVRFMTNCDADECGPGLVRLIHGPQALLTCSDWGDQAGYGMLRGPLVRG